MTADGPATSGPVTAQSEDVTNISSRGLLPQLTDVLHALTEGQELLSLKVRIARLEYGNHMTPVVERCLQPESSDFAGPSTYIGTSPTASAETLRKAPSDNVELGGGPTSIKSCDNGPLPEQGVGSSAAPVPATVPEAASPSNPPDAIVTHAGTPNDLSSETPGPTDGLNSVQPGEATTAPLNRDYNFFDALDARLADLEGTADPTGDS